MMFSGAMMLFACSGGVVEQSESSGLVQLEGGRLLRRISLDIRGVVPSLEELEQASSSREALEDMWPQWLEDPRFEERLVDLFAEQWLTRVDDYNVTYLDFQLDESSEYEFLRSIGEEPLRLIAKVIVNDLPYSEIATADYMYSNEFLSEMWPISRGDSSDEWGLSTWTDDRPSAGVLASNGLWWRYYTTPFNYNRGRSSAVARLLLCEDYLERPVKFTEAPALLNEGDTENAIKSSESCMACHTSLDPMASALFGFWWYEIYDPAEMSRYHADREPLGETILGVAPEFFGIPVSGLGELGQALTLDPRFKQCAVQTAATMFWRRHVSLVDFVRLSELREEFESTGLNYKALVESIMRGEIYRAGGFTEDVGDATEAREEVYRIMSPEMLSSAVLDLTGFEWLEGGWEQLESDRTGFRVLAGGLDGVGVTQPSRGPSLTWALVVKRLAQGAAYHAVAGDSVGEGPNLLSAGVGVSAGDPNFDLELERLFLRLFGREVTPDEQASYSEFFSVVEAETSQEAAWRSLLSVMLRDPEFVSY